MGAVVKFKRGWFLDFRPDKKAPLGSGYRVVVEMVVGVYHDLNELLNLCESRFGGGVLPSCGTPGEPGTRERCISVYVKLYGTHRIRTCGLKLMMVRVVPDTVGPLYVSKYVVRPPFVGPVASSGVPRSLVVRPSVPFSGRSACLVPPLNSSVSANPAVPVAPLARARPGLVVLPGIAPVVVPVLSVPVVLPSPLGPSRIIPVVQHMWGYRDDTSADGWWYGSPTRSISPPSRPSSSVPGPPVDVLVPVVPVLGSVGGARVSLSVVRARPVSGGVSNVVACDLLAQRQLFQANFGVPSPVVSAPTGVVCGACRCLLPLSFVGSLCSLCCCIFGMNHSVGSCISCSSGAQLPPGSGSFCVVCLGVRVPPFVYRPPSLLFQPCLDSFFIGVNHELSGMGRSDSVGDMVMKIVLLVLLVCPGSVGFVLVPVLIMISSLFICVWCPRVFLVSMLLTFVSGIMFYWVGSRAMLAVSVYFLLSRKAYCLSC
jgi:hypothetical protein